MRFQHNNPREVFSVVFAHGKCLININYYESHIQGARDLMGQGKLQYRRCGPRCSRCVARSTKGTGNRATPCPGNQAPEQFVEIVGGKF